MASLPTEGADMNEFRLALRRLGQHPKRSATAAFTLALGIGAITAAFAAVDSVLLRPLPVRDQDELVVVRQVDAERGSIRLPFGSASYAALARGLRSVDGFAAVETRTMEAIAEGADGPYILRQNRVAGDFFGVLGSQPALGRLLDAGDDRVGAPPVAVLSYATWTSRFGQRPDVLGSILRFAGRSFTLVGVAPRGFEIPRAGDVWITLEGALPNWVVEDPCCIELDVIARLGDASRSEALSADVSSVLRADPTLDPDLASFRTTVTPLDEDLTGSLESLLQIGFAAALFLLVAAIANASLLLLSGAGLAARELAVRKALGAERAQVLFRMLADATLAAALGAAGGLALAWIAVRGVLPLAPADLPRLGQVTVGPAAVVFAILAGLLSAGLAGALAGLTFSRVDVRALLASSGRSQTPSADRVRRPVAALQVALTVVTAVGAGLLVRTVLALDGLDQGLEAENLSVVTLDIPHTFRQVPPAYFGELESVVADLEGRAGVESVLPTLQPPLDVGLAAVLRTPEQTESDAAANPFVWLDAVLPGHFEALGMEIRAGRALTESDNLADSDPVVVVSEATARAFWPGQNPLGRRISGFIDPTWWTVVGVVADTRYSRYLEPTPAAYYPMRRLGTAPPSRLLIRTSDGNARTIRAMVNEAFAGVDARVRVLTVDPVRDLLRSFSARQRFAASVLLLFSGITLFLAFLGVYGVFGLWVDERTREIGIRCALGAQRARIVAWVLRGAVTVALPGAALGILGALFANRLLASLLYGVSPTDAGTFVTVFSIAVAVAAAAALSPALRASGTDPSVAMRHE
jgi:predicted permease